MTPFTLKKIELKRNLNIAQVQGRLLKGWVEAPLHLNANIVLWEYDQDRVDQAKLFVAHM